MIYSWNNASYVSNVVTSDSLCCEGNTTLQCHAQHIALYSVMAIYYNLTDIPNPASTQDGHKMQKIDYI